MPQLKSQVFAGGVAAPEGPVCLADGSMYVTEMADGHLCVTRLWPDATKRIVRKTNGRPNGLAVDGHGRIWVAEAGKRAVICLSSDGEEELRIEDNGERHFRFPNDLVFGPDGHLYVTDTGLAMEDFLDGQNFAEGFEEFPWDGCIYDVDIAKGGVVRTIDEKIRFTNGIAFDTNDRLYVNASIPGDVYRYDVFADAMPQREYFGNVLQEDDRPGFKGPDGMKFGTDGRLYCAVYGQGNVTVLAQDGSVAERWPTLGQAPTNCAFSLSGTELLVTEVEIGQVEKFAAPCHGAPLYYPK